MDIEFQLLHRGWAETAPPFLLLLTCTCNTTHLLLDEPGLQERLVHLTILYTLRNLDLKYSVLHFFAKQC